MYSTWDLSRSQWVIRFTIFYNCLLLEQLLIWKLGTVNEWWALDNWNLSQIIKKLLRIIRDLSQSIDSSQHIIVKLKCWDRQSYMNKKQQKLIHPIVDKLQPTNPRPEHKMRTIQSSVPAQKKPIKISQTFDDGQNKPICSRGNSKAAWTNYINECEYDSGVCAEPWFSSDAYSWGRGSARSRLRYGGKDIRSSWRRALPKRWGEEPSGRATAREFTIPSTLILHPFAPPAATLFPSFYVRPVRLSASY